LVLGVAEAGSDSRTYWSAAFVPDMAKTSISRLPVKEPVEGVRLAKPFTSV